MNEYIHIERDRETDSMKTVFQEGRVERWGQDTLKENYRFRNVVTLIIPYTVHVPISINEWRNEWTYVGNRNWFILVQIRCSGRKGTRNAFALQICDLSPVQVELFYNSQNHIFNDACDPNDWILLWITTFSEGQSTCTIFTPYWFGCYVLT